MVVVVCVCVCACVRACVCVCVQHWFPRELVQIHIYIIWVLFITYRNYFICRCIIIQLAVGHVLLQFATGSTSPDWRRHWWRDSHSSFTRWNKAWDKSTEADCEQGARKVSLPTYCWIDTSCILLREVAYMQLNYHRRMQLGCTTHTYVPIQCHHHILLWNIVATLGWRQPVETQHWP